MMLVSLIVIEALMREAGLESMLVSTVHDSLLIDAVREELPVLHEIVYWVLNNFHEVLPAYFGPQYDTSWMIVPFAGDCEVGLNYYDMSKVEAEDNDWDKLLAT
jgi:DNA polymerase I-like protein with 3'-5' exonuclease and polymerase domains